MFVSHCKNLVLLCWRISKLRSFEFWKMRLYVRSCKSLLWKCHNSNNRVPCHDKTLKLVALQQQLLQEDFADVSLLFPLPGQTPTTTTAPEVPPFLWAPPAAVGALGLFALCYWCFYRPGWLVWRCGRWRNAWCISRKCNRFCTKPCTQGRCAGGGGKCPRPACCPKGGGGSGPSCCGGNSGGSEEVELRKQR